MLKIIDVKVTVDGNNEKVEILKKINLALENNKIYVITGPNGGGKSSIAKAIMGIIPINGGQIILDDANITDKNITERAQLGIGYAFQTPARFKGLKVKEMLDLAAGNHKIDNCQVLFDVGLCAQDYLDREIDSTFSGGELKRIEIASILARNLKVAIFDEPEAGIDLWSFQRMTETFLKMHRKSDSTVIIISHQERILKFADEVILIEDGNVTKTTSHEEFLKEIAHLDTGCDCRNDCIKGGTYDSKCGR